jgi:hypothetical protein
LAQVVHDNLAAIQIDVQPQFFPVPEFFGRIATPGEPWDLALPAWNADYADPWDFIDVLLNGKNAPGAGGSDINYGSFDDPTFNQRRATKRTRLSTTTSWPMPRHGLRGGTSMRGTSSRSESAARSSTRSSGWTSRPSAFAR